MKFRSINAIYRPNKAYKPWTLKEGEFCYNKDFTSMHCWPPTDGEPVDNGLRTLDIVEKWNWNGDIEYPTLEGSVACGEDGEYWHGYLEAGYWKACE